MANTTDMVITTFENDREIEKINVLAGSDFRKISDGGLCGGNKIGVFGAYAECSRSLGGEQVEKVIYCFLNSALRDFTSSLSIDDDDNAVFPQCIVKGVKRNELDL